MNSFTISSKKAIPINSTVDINLHFESDKALSSGSKIWLFYDIRQDGGLVQNNNKEADNFLSTSSKNGHELATTIHGDVSRTMDLYPSVPEFHTSIEFTLSDNPGQQIDISIKNWHTPLRPIKKFHFWIIVDQDAVFDFVPTGHKCYRKFIDRLTGKRIASEILSEHLMKSEIRIEGEYRNVPALNVRKVPGVFWGELHGMAFNQRPLDDFYNYAKNITQLDFCSAVRFSYNTCVGNEWEIIKDAAKRHTESGKFVAFAGFESGTPEDDSHRCAYFPEPDNVPPIFCDSRPSAQDPMLQKRFHPDTIICNTLKEYYAAIKRFGGFVGGHFHTDSYDEDILAEMWQKQDVNMRCGKKAWEKLNPLYKCDSEEERIYEYMRQGKRFGLVGGSDTHDSMPGNPNPEPGCPHPAGFTGVWAHELSTKALTEAFLKRRVFATTGARIMMKFESNGQPMGSEFPAGEIRQFSLNIEGTANLKSVEILRNGKSWLKWSPHKKQFQIEAEDKTNNTPAFYLVRVIQENGHKGWTSPIWFK